MDRFWRDDYAPLLVYTLCYFATRVEPLVVSPLIPDITTALDTTSGTIGMAMTGFWAAYALAQVPSGILTDRYGHRRLIVGVLFAGSAGSIVLSRAPSVLVFIGAAVALGGSLGLYYNAGVLALDDRFTETGRMLGIHRTGSQVAGLVVPVAAAAIGARYSWRTGLLLGAIASLPTAVVVLGVIAPTPPSGPTPSIRAQLERTVTKLNPGATIGGVTVLAGIGEFVAVANLTFMPTFLRSAHGIGPLLAGGLFSMYFLVVTGTHPVAGWCSDRIGPDAVVAVALAVGVVSHGLLVVVRTQIGAIVGVGLAALTLGYNIPLQSKLLGSVADESRASVFGGFRTLYILIGSLGGVVTGTIADRVGWDAAYAFLTVLLLVALVGLLASRVVLPRTGNDE